MPGSEADLRQKTLILDLFLASTGYARKYAIKLLTQPLPPTAPAPIRRPRPRAYGAEVQEALSTLWAAANGICARRLVPFLPDQVVYIEASHALVIGLDQVLRHRDGDVCLFHPRALQAHAYPISFVSLGVHCSLQPAPSGRHVAFTASG